MSTVVSFGNKNIVEPGVYSQIKSGINVKPQAFSTGNVMIIDTGEGAGINYGGGSGITGELTQGKKSIYSFDDLVDFRRFVRGGLLWDLADYLFNPINGAQGVQKLILVRAATTTSASNTYTFTGSTGNAQLQVVITSGVITAVNILDGGSGFTSATITVTGVGTGANITATVTSGVITATTIVSGGTGYVAASTTITATGSVGGGTFSFKTKNEGTGANGTQTLNKVRTGYGCLMKQGVINPAAFKIEFYEGTFKGLDADGDAFDGLPIDMCNPLIVSASPEFTNLASLINWAKNDFGFNARFQLDLLTSAVVGTGIVDTLDYSTNNTLVLTTGATEAYNPSDLDKVLESVGEIDCTFFLSLKSEANAQGVENTKLLSHIVNDAEFKKFIFVGGGNDISAFTGTNSSIETSAYFDSPYVTVVHSGFKIRASFSAQDKMKRVLYHTATVLGRIAGLQPQTPGTFKGLRITRFLHELTQSEREIALQAGVLHNRFVPQLGYVINQSINTVQFNTQQILPNGFSHEISIMRIAEQLNKELTLNMRPIFIGGNLNTSSPADVKAFVEGYLTFKTATKTEDNLIIRFEKVTVKQTEDYYEVTYAFVPNGPLNKIFITGFLLEANLSA